MERCPECQKEFKTKAALAGHIFHIHRNPGFRLNAKQINSRLAGLEDRTQAIERSIVEVVKITAKYYQTLAQELQAEAAASFKRDNQLLEELQVVSRDSTKNIENLLEITHGIQENEAAMLKVLNDMAHLKLKLVKKEEAKV